MTLIISGRGMGRGGARGRGGRNKPPRYSNQMQSANNQFSQNMMYSQNSQVCILRINFVVCIIYRIILYWCLYEIFICCTQDGSQPYGSQGPLTQGMSMSQPFQMSQPGLSGLSQPELSQVNKVKNLNYLNTI